VHAPGVGQYTEESKSCRSGRLRVDSTVQLLPSHRSARLTSFPAAFAASPTAVQSEPETHQTPDSLLKLRSGRTGSSSSTQTCPFHRAAYADAPFAVVDCPTAEQAVTDEHDTCKNVIEVTWARGAGAASSAQLIPFHLKIRGSD
jgi:hypothetical protein